MYTMGSFSLFVYICTGLFLGIESTELKHGCFDRESKYNETWPIDECNSIFIKSFSCEALHLNLGSTCHYKIIINNTLLPEGINMILSREKFDPTCKCNCNCNCNQSNSEDIIANISKEKNSFQSRSHNIQNMMESGCYRFYMRKHNISSCCVHFPAYDHVENVKNDKDMKTEEVKEDKKSDVHRDDQNWIYWSIPVTVALLVLVALIVISLCVWKQKSFTQHPLVELTSHSSKGNFSESPPATKAKRLKGNQNLLLIYSNQSHDQFREILNQLIRGIETAVKDCTVCDYRNCGSLLDRGFHWLYEDKFDKVIVLLSPELLTLQSSDAERSDDNFHSKFSHHFFTEYLLHHHSNNKIIYVSLEQFPGLGLSFFCPSVILSLPTKLKDLLQLLHFEGDDCVIENVEFILRKEMDRIATHLEANRT